MRFRGNVLTPPGKTKQYKPSVGRDTWNQTTILESEINLISILLGQRVRQDGTKWNVSHVAVDVLYFIMSFSIHATFPSCAPINDTTSYPYVHALRNLYKLNGRNNRATIYDVVNLSNEQSTKVKVWWWKWLSDYDNVGKLTDIYIFIYGISINTVEFFVWHSYGAQATVLIYQP